MRWYVNLLFGGLPLLAIAAGNCQGQEGTHGEELIF